MVFLPLKAGALVAERSHKILANKAAGNRLNHILGNEAPKANKPAAKPVTSNTGGARDFGKQRLICEAEARKVVAEGVGEILVSRRTILTPMTQDLLREKGIKVTFNDPFINQSEVYARVIKPCINLFCRTF